MSAARGDPRQRRLDETGAGRKRGGERFDRSPDRLLPCIHDHKLELRQVADRHSPVLNREITAKLRIDPR